MYDWNKLDWESEICQLISCPCHLPPSDKWAGRKMHRQTQMIQVSKIPGATRSLKDCSLQAETHMELQGPQQMWQPLPSPAISFPSSCQQFGCLGLGAPVPLAAQPWLCITSAMRCGGGQLLSYYPLPRLQQDNAVIGCSPVSPSFDTVVFTKNPATLCVGCTWNFCSCCLCGQL